MPRSARLARGYLKPAKNGQTSLTSTGLVELRSFTGRWRCRWCHRGGDRTCGGIPDRACRSSAYRTIGFLGATLNGYYFGALLAGVVDAAKATDARVVAIQTVDCGLDRETLGEHPFTSTVAWNHIDAFIVVIDSVSDSYVRQIVDSGKPLVLISREVTGVSCPIVVPDNARGVQASIDHLVGHGHERIAFVSRSPDCADDRLRLAAYQRELGARGLRVYEKLTVPWAGNEISAREVAERLLTMPDRPTAVVVATDVTAIMLVRELVEAGASVPGDIAVVGFDDIEDAASSQPPLSTIAQSFVAAGGIAGRLAIDALNGEPGAPGYHLAPVSFVARESCGCPGLGFTTATNSALGRSVKEQFAVDLVAALHEEADLPPSRSLDVTELIAGLFERGGWRQTSPQPNCWPRPPRARATCCICCRYDSMAVNGVSWRCRVDRPAAPARDRDAQPLGRPAHGGPRPGTRCRIARSANESIWQPLPAGALTAGGDPGQRGAVRAGGGCGQRRAVGLEPGRGYHLLLHTLEVPAGEYTDSQIGANPSEWFGRVHPDDRLALERKLAGSSGTEWPPWSSSTGCGRGTGRTGG